MSFAETNSIKTIVESQFGYFPLIWMFRSRRVNNKINRLHECPIRKFYKTVIALTWTCLKKQIVYHLSKKHSILRM